MNIFIFEKNRMPTILLSVFMLWLTSGNLAAEAFELKQVADGIYVHEGKHIGLDDPGRDDIANIGFIEGDDCIAVIDTGGSMAVGQQLLAQIKQRSSKPVCYVINTHIHFDHVLGNSVFKDEQPRFIGHRNLPDEMESNITFFIEQFSRELGGKPDRSDIIKPDMLVEDTLEIDLGNRILVIQAYPPAHTRTDLSVYDKNSKTLWLSDLLFVERLPVLDGSLKGWLQVMQDNQAVDAAIVIPGHGPVSSTPEVAFNKQYAYLQTLLDETRAMINEGAFMEEVIDEVGKEEKLTWTLYEQQHKRNVSNAFIELEWE